MPKKANLIGKRFGRLVVTREVPKEERKYDKVTWECQCDCGNTIWTYTSALNSGNTQSCGCLRKEKIIQRNLDSSSVKIGQKYGKLTVIKDLGLRQQKSRDKRERWSLCQCDCGNQIEVSNNMLQSGWKQSCGCLSSQGELKIENMLKEHNLNYSKEYSFSDLKGINGGLLRFDFCVFDMNNNILFLIEFDGRQHEQGYDTDYWKHYTNEEIAEHDKRKNLYCKNKGLILKRIPYTDKKTFTYEDLLSNKYNIT